MLKIEMQFINQPDEPNMIIWLTRVPCMGEVIVLKCGAAYGVRSVLHFANAHHDNESAALIRVAGK